MAAAGVAHGRSGQDLHGEGDAGGVGTIQRVAWLPCVVDAGCCDEKQMDQGSKPEDE